MRAMFDLNVFVDIAEAREGFYEKSREAFETALSNGVEVFFPVHGFTTLHYLLAHAHKSDESRTHIAWLCDHVSCAPTGIRIIRAACASEGEDFEDAVVDETAFSVGCDVIVTRNKKHFISSKVKAVSPEEFIGMTLPLQHGE